MQITNIKADFCSQTPDGQRRMLVDLQGVDAKSLVGGMSDDLRRDVREEIESRDRTLIFKAELSPALCHSLQQASERFGCEGAELLAAVCDKAMEHAEAVA